MGLISRFGSFLDRIFAPKATAEQVSEMISKNVIASQSVIQEKINNLAEECNKNSENILKLRDELTAIKALYKIGGTKTESHITQKFDGSQPWKR